jgi:DNA repair protein RecN (Recombination protein N)
MLTDLLIRNFAIIDELQVSFGDGLNLISGETGAGKSIIIGAISLLLGDRASIDMIRSTEETALVEACFYIAGMEPLQQKLQELGLDGGNQLVIKRSISRSGKNKVFINGSIGNLGMLSSVCELLVNICGQREHQVLLNKENHIDILDDFGGLREFRQEYEGLYCGYLSLKTSLAELESQQASNKALEELHGFQLKDIVEAAVCLGEDELLQDEKRVITNMQKLIGYADSAHDKLYGSQGSVLEGLRLVSNNIREIKKIDGGIKITEQDLEGIYYQLEDMALCLRDYGKNLSVDPRRLEAIEERLELLSLLKRKYGGSLAAVLKSKEDLEKSLEDKSALQEDIEQKKQSLLDITSKLQDKAHLLSEQRRLTAERLKYAIEAEIHTLKMDKASFEVLLQKLPESGEHFLNVKGMDAVEFYLSTNRGEELKPLARIASGGELSRIVLAMKKVLAGSGSVGTIIFDEVDTGIGGAIAEIVGEKLRDVSGHYQVICITHLPQIACFANRHFLVSKQETAERTKTIIRSLSEEERLDEIARMLAGVELTEKAREHAREMMNASRFDQR